MPRKPQHFTPQTVAKTDAAFEEVIALVGIGRFDAARQARVRAISIDGVPIGADRAALRGPDTSYFAQSYLEPLAVAGFLVDLNLDADHVDLHCADKPDVTVTYSDRPAIYVEQRMVTEYDGTPFARHLEQLNVALRDRAAIDTRFAQVCTSGSLTVRLTDPGFKVRPDRAQTVDEIAAFTSHLTNDISLARPDPPAFPALSALAAAFFYRAGSTTNPSICGEDALCIDPRPAWVGARLRSALQEKSAKVVGYDPNAKPLWLLLNLDGPHLYPAFVEQLVRAALGPVSTKPFDRVIVCYPGLKPIVLDCN